MLLLVFIIDVLLLLQTHPLRSLEIERLLDRELTIPLCLLIVAVDGLDENISDRRLRLLLLAKHVSGAKCYGKDWDLIVDLVCPSHSRRVDAMLF